MVDEYESQFQGYTYWGKRVYQNAVEDPMTDHTDQAEMQEFTEEMAELLCLNEDKLLNKVEDAAGFSVRGMTGSPEYGRAFQ